MKKEYDLSKFKSRKNPYAKNLKKQITIRLGTEAIDYFKELSNDTGMSYQNLINSYLMDCVLNKEETCDELEITQDCKKANFLYYLNSKKERQKAWL